MTLMTFGSGVEESCVCDLVRLNIALRSGNQKQLLLLTIPFTCQPLSSQPVTFCQDTLNHIINLNLANPSGGRSQLDVNILIGSDQFWELVIDKICRGSDAPVAIETAISWVLSGPAPIARTTQHSILTTTHVLKVDAAP